LSSGDALSPELEPVDPAPIPAAEEAPLVYTVQEDDVPNVAARVEESILLASYTLSSGDSLSSESGPVDHTPIFQGTDRSAT